MNWHNCKTTLNNQKLGNDLDVTTEKLTTDQDSGFENDDQDQEESTDSTQELPIGNGKVINRDLVLSTTSKVLLDDTSDQNDNSGTIVQESPNLGNGLNQLLGGLKQFIFRYFF